MANSKEKSSTFAAAAAASRRCLPSHTPKTRPSLHCTHQIATLKFHAKFTHLAMLARGTFSRMANCQKQAQTNQEVKARKETEEVIAMAFYSYSAENLTNMHILSYSNILKFPWFPCALLPISILTKTSGHQTNQLEHIRTSCSNGVFTPLQSH